MSDLLKRLEPGKHGPRSGTTDFTQVRKVPLQPEGVLIGVVFMGADLGNLPWVGIRPRAGDTVAVVGTPGNRTVVGREQPRLTNPVFGDRCVCRCPASSTGGMIAYLTQIQTTSILLVIDGATGAVLHYQTLPEVFSAAGVAVDPSSPHDLFILDNRQGSVGLPVDGAIVPDPTKQWFFIQRYVVSGNSYVFATTEILPNAFSDSVPVGGFNTLSVIDGECYITLDVSPAKFIKWSGSGFTAVTLTQNGDPYGAVLQGNIVTVPSKPASTTALHCLALVVNTWQVLRFNADGEITGLLESEEFINPVALLTVCNRLYVYQSFGPFRGEEEEDEGDGGGGGGGDPPGEET